MFKNINYKFVLVGDSAVGKSSIATRYVSDDFYEFQEPTIGAAFLAKTIEMDDKKIKLEIWDTAGQEIYRSLAPMYYRNASGAIVIYDVTKKDSFDGAKSWIAEILRRGNPDCVIALLGNKYDLSNEIKVDYDKVKEYITKNNIIHFYCSAKTGKNIKQVFDSIIKKLILKNDEGIKKRDLHIKKEVNSKCC